MKETDFSLCPVCGQPLHLSSCLFCERKLFVYPSETSCPICYSPTIYIKPHFFICSNLHCSGYSLRYVPPLLKLHTSYLKTKHFYIEHRSYNNSLSIHSDYCTPHALAHISISTDSGLESHLLDNDNIISKSFIHTYLKNLYYSL